MTQAPESQLRSTKQQERSILSTTLLVRAAAELLVEVGYDRMTLAAIGKRAGYSYGLVTQRFGSKEGLMWALVESMIVGWSADRRRGNTSNMSWLQRLRPIIEGVRASAAKDPVSLRALWAVMFEATKPGTILNERVRELHRNQRNGTARAIEQEIRAGRISADLVPDATAAVVIGALRGLAYQWLLDPEFDYDGALEALEQIMDRLALTEDARGAARPKVASTDDA